MNLQLNPNLAHGYTNPAQIARRLTEDWVGRTIFCPNCGRVDIAKFENGRPVADFYCANCREEYELKSKQGHGGQKIVDGAYGTMMERLASKNNPNFFFLNYNSATFNVANFLVIPKHFFVPEIIEKRKALAPTARRHGWVGCNILLQSIPQTGKIFFVKNGQIQLKEKVTNEWKKTLFLRDEVVSAKGWLIDIMKCIEELGRPEFELSDIYTFEDKLSLLHPDNKHIKDKIRQQLQILRDNGYLKFLGNGKYVLS